MVRCRSNDDNIVSQQITPEHTRGERREDYRNIYLERSRRNGATFKEQRRRSWRDLALYSGSDVVGAA